MVDRIAKLIATKIVLANETDEDREIYEYGLQIILNTLFSISIVLLLGFLMNEMQGTIVFLICYCSLRLFAGGLHADTNNKCMTIFICGYLVFAIIIKNIEVTLNFSSIAVLLGSIICIVLWAPVDVPNNPIPISKKRIMKRNSFFMVLIITSAIFIMLYNRLDNGGWAFAGLSWFLCILSAGKIKNIIYLRRYENEKSYKKNLSDD